MTTTTTYEVEGLSDPATRTLTCFDTETFRIDQKAQFPRIVCMSVVMGGESDLLGNDDWDRLRETCVSLLTDKSLQLANQTIGYDLGVIATNFPGTITSIFDAIADGRVHDTAIREKLLVLAESGDLDQITNPDGSSSRRSFSLASMMLEHFGIDLKASKELNDAWRTNFNVFDNMPVDQWPAEARQYVLDDSTHARNLYLNQEARRVELAASRGIDPFITQEFRVMVDFCLKLMSSHGAMTDPEMIAEVEKQVNEELTPEKLNLLYQGGILRPAVPPRMHKRYEKNLDTRQEGWVVDPSMMTKGTPESVDTKILKVYVEEVARRLNGPCKECNGSGCDKCRGTGIALFGPEIKLHYTDASKKFPEGQLSVDGEFLEDYAHLDPVLEQYANRQKLQKIVTTELPRMKLNGVVADVVYPQYDCLKETGRTSSFSSKSEEYASFNCQNVDPRVRRCFVPRPGFLLFSIDYSQMELGTLAQTCYWLFGYSVLRDKINAGIDVHAYTGAQLAADMDEGFKASVAGMDANARATLFMGMKKSNETFYNHWRKFAKPVNLGYPGGLGPDTFRKLAKVAYDVIVDRDTAERFRDLWKETYPEMVDYFRHVNKNCIDPHNKGWNSEDKEEYDMYAYTSPYGMHRAGCAYCACANGIGLQTPSAEGALTGMCDVMRECWDASQKSVLFGTRPWGFIHDELVGEVADDEHAHDKMMRMKELLIASMRVITPDVAVNANPCLMRRWDKDAKPVFNAEGRLTVWTPEVK